jgi:hypothetical protein
VFAGFLDESVDIDQSDQIKRALSEPQILKCTGPISAVLIVAR